VGADPVGDVQVVPQGQDPIRPQPLLRVEDGSQVRFADLVRDDPANLDSPIVPRVARRELGYAFEELVAGLLAVVAQR
jgi:hypothetical protein